MKRSIIAAAVLLLLLSSATYAAPPRPQPRVRVRVFWGSVLAWLGITHHPGPSRMARPCPPAHRPPAFVPRHKPNPGRHLGWEKGRHNGWSHGNQPRGQRPGNGKPREGEQGRGRG
jgi:hypothetical protein